MENASPLSHEHSTLEKHIKKANLWAAVISISAALITGLSVGYGFYYNTQNNIQNNSEDIREVKTDVKGIHNTLNDMQVNQGVSQEQVKTLNDNLKTTNEKLDKVLMELARRNIN